MPVRFWDPQGSFRALESEVMSTVREVFAGGDLIMRHQLDSFEAALADFVGTNYAVGVSTCTDGLRLILEALGIGNGDEVITVAHTFVATMAAIRMVGATPILVDVGPDHNMDTELLEAAITPRTRAVIPVHLNGRLCRMDHLMDIAQRHSIAVVEDTAQALGGSYEGVRGGQWGIAGAFSFYPAKLLGAYGDAGAVVTSDPAVAQRVRALRDHGRISKTELSGWGHNCRLDNLQAALLKLKLPRVLQWIERRRHLAALYDESLSDVLPVRRPPAPSPGPYYDVFQNYVVEAHDRDGLKSQLDGLGIETLVSWPIPNHHQPLGLAHFLLPRTEQLSKTVLSLPLHTELHDEQVLEVADAVRHYYT